MIYSRLGPIFGRAQWRLAIALPVAAATTAAAPPATPSFAQLALILCTFLTRLRLAEAVFFLGRSTVMVFVCDRVFWRRLVREILPVLHVVTRLAAATPATAAASSPAPAAAFAFAALHAFDALLYLCFGYAKLGFLEMLVDFDHFVLDFLDWRQLRLLGGEVTRGFRRVHLFTAVDHIRLLAGDRSGRPIP